MPAAQPGSHSPHGTVQSPRHLLIGKIFEIPQQHRDPELRGQRRHRLPHRLRHLRARMEAFAAPGSQEEDYARTQMAKSVREAVSALPPKFRIAVLLRYFEDLSYE